MLDQYASWYEKKKEGILADFFEYLSFPSVSTDSNYASNVNDCCDWLSQKLYSMGYTTETWQTDGHPILFGTLLEAGPAFPTLLIYLHYDVQPVDPIDEWISPPFEPEVRDGYVYARGAIDNKGQCYYTLAALHAFKELGATKKVNIKVVIEGEEEIGSPTLFSLIENKREDLAADYCVIVDVDIPSVKQPAITLGNRGILTLNTVMKTAESDLHSGSFGGIAQNPNHIFSKIVSSFWNEDGSVAISGFYDGIEELSDEERKLLTHSDTLQTQLKELGIRSTIQEKGYSIFETGSIRPTLEVNGFHGGYGGEGCKTVIPKKAELKVSCRLVPGQNGERVLKKLKNHISERIPKGIEFEFTDDHFAPAFRAPFTSTFAQLVRDSYTDVLGVECGTILCGGTIPITIPLASLVKGNLVLMGYCLLDDGMHAPNERFSLDRFRLGYLTMTSLFDKLSKIC